MSYLGYLAATLRPQRLVSTAARRALRIARLKLSAGTAPILREELLAGLASASPGELAHLLAVRPRGFIAPVRPAEIRVALDRWFPGERDRVLARAEEAAAGRVTVFGRSCDVNRLAGGTDWQLDPFHHGRFAGWAPSFELPEAPGLDIKMAWALGRGDQWLALACGACADPSRADLFAESFAASVSDFLARNPVGRGAHWASPMEVALRVSSLVQAHRLFAGSRALTAPGFALDLARLVVTSGRFVLLYLEDDQAVPNNHLAAEWLGLLACALFLPEWPESPRWRELALAGLARECQAQTHPDGTSFEGSIPYHRLALEIFTAAALLCRSHRIPFGGAGWRRLAAMYRATRALLCRGGALPQIGDNDSGRVFAYRERPALDGSYLLPLGAAALGDPRLRVEPGARGAEEALWLCGPAAVARLASSVRPGPAPVSASFPRAGFHVLRRGRFEVAVSCGRSGQEGLGGHSHNDKLALELRLDGELTVCDPGTFCYTGDPERRNLFRSTRAHATVLVDGEEQVPFLPGRLFALLDTADAVLLAFESEPGYERLVGEHGGYARLGLTHRREILLGEEALAVSDHLLGDGFHSLELHWPLPSRAARVRPLDRAERDRLASLGSDIPDPDLFDLRSAIEIGDPARALLVSACPPGFRAALDPSFYSPGYGEAREACTAVFAGRALCPARLTTVILPLAPPPQPKGGS